jgi:predicted PurR-regulated permease PerM
MRGEPGHVLSPTDRRRFFAALIAGQTAGVVGLVLGGVLFAMALAFLASAAGPYLATRLSPSYR